MSASFAVQNTVAGLQEFDGKNLPLKDFIQDLKNSAALLPAGQEANFVRLALTKLRGTARDSTYGQTFKDYKELIKHLKKRFAPGKDFSYYNTKINSLRMKQGDTVGDFYDRLNILLDSATHALKEKQGGTYNDLMMTPLTQTSKDIFIRGLPKDIRQLVWVTHPNTLKEAFEEAVKIENAEQVRSINDPLQRLGLSDYATGPKWNLPNKNQIACIDEQEYYDEEEYDDEEYGYDVQQQMYIAEPNMQHQQQGPSGYQHQPQFQQNYRQGRRPFFNNQPRQFRNGNWNWNQRRQSPGRQGRLFNPDTGTYQYITGRRYGAPCYEPRNEHQGTPRYQNQGQQNIDLRPTPAYAQPHELPLNSNGARPKILTGQTSAKPTNQNQNQNQNQTQIQRQPIGVPPAQVMRILQKPRSTESMAQKSESPRIGDLAQAVATLMNRRE